MTASNMRDALLMWFGGMIAIVGTTIAVIVGLSVTFPWNIFCIMVGVLLAIGGVKLFIKGHDG